MDRRAANTALAKAIAYVECGKRDEASEWLEDLVKQFEDEGVLARRGSPPLPAVEAELAASDMSAASAWLGGRLLGREGSVQL